MSAGDPLQLGPTGHAVVRLNRRVVYVVGAVLIGAFMTGLIAIRAQGTRASEGGAQGRTALQPRSHPWFEGVPDQDPTPRSAALDPLPSPSTSPSSPRLVAGAPSTEEPEAQRERRVLRAAMSAPISVAAFERGPSDHAARRRASPEAAAAVPAGIVVPADRAQAQRTSGTASGSDAPGALRVEPKANGLPPEYLLASVRMPVSPFEVKAGTIIPAVMLGAINSDLPGQILGQVRENVYDSDTGQHLLIPQGTRLVGLYDHKIVYGQERVLITWKRLILPSGSSLSLKDGMPGTDALGAAGFHDQVNNHYLRIFGNALLLSVISAGVQLSQVPDFGRDNRGPTAGNVLGAAVGQQLGSTAAELIRRGMTVAPTLEIRPGYPYNVMVTQDVIFPGPYKEAGQE
jgi:type IV secretion system protein VirB10